MSALRSSFFRSVTLALAGAALFTPGSAQAQECALPDLATVVPAQLQLQDTFTNEEGSNGAGRSVHTEYLRFSNSIANIGDGPLEIIALGDSTTELNDAVQNLYTAADAALIPGDAYIPDDGFSPCATNPLTDAFYFHPTHNHYHLTDVALFGVHAANDDGTGGDYAAESIGDTTKETFCLIDYVPMTGTKPGSRTYYDCLSTDADWRSQGIGVGWIDEYHQPTDFQGVELSDAPDGIYYLVSTANDAGIFTESDYENNTSWVSFRLYEHGGNRKIELIDRSDCETEDYGSDLCGKDWGGITTNR